MADGAIVATFTSKGFDRLKLTYLQYSKPQTRVERRRVYLFPMKDDVADETPPSSTPPPPSIRVNVSLVWPGDDADLLHLHVRDSHGEHVFYGNPRSGDAAVVLHQPADSPDEGGVPEKLNALTIDAREGVGYSVWAYAYTEQDIFEVSAVATVSVENAGSADLLAPRTYMQGGARYWDILRIMPNGTVVTPNTLDVQPPDGFDGD